jgi:inner membrane protein involved in colicin E2 resistance
MNLEELKKDSIPNRNFFVKYSNHIFTFKNLFKYTVIYEMKDENKTITIYGKIEYRSDLNMKETLKNLVFELEEITHIDIKNND